MICIKQLKNFEGGGSGQDDVIFCSEGGGGSNPDILYLLSAYIP